MWKEEEAGKNEIYIEFSVAYLYAIYRYICKYKYMLYYTKKMPFFARRLCDYVCSHKDFKHRFRSEYIFTNINLHSNAFSEVSLLYLYTLLHTRIAFYTRRVRNHAESFIHKRKYQTKGNRWQRDSLKWMDFSKSYLLLSCEIVPALKGLKAALMSSSKFSVRFWLYAFLAYSS